MKQKLPQLLKEIILPAKAVKEINLDYSETTTFSDFYDFNGKIIGAGGFGIVILAIDKRTFEEIAIKILNMEKYLKVSPDSFESPSYKLERNINFIKNELKIMQSLSHPCFIKVRKIYQTQYHILIVMDKAKCSLADYIHDRNLSENEVKIIIKQILEGLKYLHNNNIIHRDIKPANILLMSDAKLEGSVKIIDFSISAKMSDASLSEQIETAGTFLYKAPEQFSTGLCTTVSKIIRLVY